MEEGGGAGLTPHQIYEALTTGPGSGSLDDAGYFTSDEWAREADRAERISRIAAKIQAGWQGSAADGAYGAAGPLADVTLEGVDRMHTTGSLLGMQSHVFNSAKNSVRPVPAAPPESNILNDMAPWETDLDRQIKQYQDDAQHNIAVYSMYDGESLSNERQLPQELTTITDPGGDISVTQPGDRPPGGGSEYQPVSSSWSGGGPSPVSGPSQPVEFPQSPQGTDPSGATPTPGVRPPGVVPPPGSQPPFGGSPPVGGWPVGNVPVGGRPPGAGPDGGRLGSGKGGPPGRGAGGGPGAGALSAEEAAARRGAAGARGGAAGGGGFGPMGMGRGPGGEDEEHDRKYTVEPDPEELYGTDQVTAPPVIGMDED